MKSYQNKEEKKNLHLLPQFIYFYFFNVENNKTEKQQGHAYGEEITSSPSM
jgi:hypothetical protein